MENLYNFFENDLQNLIEIKPKQKYVKVICYTRYMFFFKARLKNAITHRQIYDTTRNYRMQLEDLIEYFTSNYNSDAKTCLLIYNVKTGIISVHHNIPRDAFERTYCFTLDKN